MKTIDENIQAIRVAVYGKEVRTAIADSIEDISNRQEPIDINEATRISNELERKSKEVERLAAEVTRVTEWDTIKDNFDKASENIIVKTFKYEEGYYTSTADGTTSFNLNAVSFNPLTDSVELSYSDGANMFIDKDYTKSGSRIDLLGWSLPKDDFIHWFARKGTTELEPPGTNGADLMEQSVAKSKLEISVQNDLNEIGDLPSNGITESTLAEAVKNDRAQLADKVQQLPYFDILKKDNSLNFYGIKLVSWLGDSISFGLNTVDRINDAWLGIVRKMLQAELGTTNFGVEGINVSASFNNMHNITKTGTWTWRNTGVNLGLQVMESVNSDATLKFTAKKTQKYFKILFDMQSGGGSLGVYIDGVFQNNINTDGTALTDKVSIQYTVPSTAGDTFEIELRKLDANNTSIGGVWYSDDFAKYNFMPIVKSGQKLVDIETDLLDKACSASVLFMCLGHNDRGTDDTNLATFTQKINTIISKCNQYNTFVVVPDFIWTNSTNDLKFKNELKRLATETNGLYINFNNYLGHGDNAKMLDLGFFEGSDYSHPTIHGHKIIAEAISKNVGLSMTSKELSNSYLKLINPIILQSTWTNILDTNLGVPFTNSFATTQYISKYMKVGKTVSVFLQVNTNSATASSIIFTLPVGYRPMTGLNFVAIVSTTTKEVNQIAVSEGGVITWVPTSTAFGNMKINFKFDTL